MLWAVQSCDKIPNLLLSLFSISHHGKGHRTWGCSVRHQIHGGSKQDRVGEVYASSEGDFSKDGGQRREWIGEATERVALRVPKGPRLQMSQDENKEVRLIGWKLVLTFCLAIDKWLEMSRRESKLTPCICSSVNEANRAIPSSDPISCSETTTKAPPTRSVSARTQSSSNGATNGTVVCESISGRRTRVIKCMLISFI